jgi:predicted nucleotidyltransferase
VSVVRKAGLCYNLQMNAQTAIAILRRHESDLRSRGVVHAAVFGSVARGENRPNSDLDIIVEFKTGSEGSIYDYVRFKEYVAGLFDVPVDVIDRAALKPHLRVPAARDAKYAF